MRSRDFLFLVSLSAVLLNLTDNAASLEDHVAASRRNAIVRAIEAVEPAVVSINVIQRREYMVRSRDPFFDFFYPFTYRRFRHIQSVGSGFIVDERGYILTNDHVVEGAVEVLINLPDKRSFKVKDVRRHIRSFPELDLAVIKIEAKDLSGAPLGDSDDIIIGEWAIAIGNPFGLASTDSRPTVTVGVISALGRDFQPKEGRVYRDMIQTDASINPGNSGGPLVNAEGKVLGINTFIISPGGNPEGGSVGIGFAIPINKAQKVLEEIVQYGRVRRPWTGIHAQDVTPWIAESLRLRETRGVIITEVEEDSPGEKAGLKVADVIVEINDTPVRDRRQTNDIFLGVTVGEVFQLKVIRDGRQIEVPLKLEPRPSKRQL